MFFGGPPRGFPGAPHGFPGFPGFPGQQNQPSADVDNTRLYELLGVGNDASPSQLKKAFRKAAMRHHPDKGGDAGVFQDINNAYEVLSDPEKRAAYDKYGEAGVGQDGAARREADHIFSRFFGGGRRPQQSTVRQAKETVVELPVTLEEMFHGATKEVRIHRKRLRVREGAAGGDVFRSCRTCGGSGMETRRVQFSGGMMHQQCPCHVCSGGGTVLKEGVDLVETEKVLSVAVPPGGQHGQPLRFAGEGDELPGCETGAAVVVLRTKPHARFHRKGHDLVYEKKLTVGEALCGFAFALAHLSGETLILRSDSITKPDSLRRVVGKGMPHVDGNMRSGDLVVIFRVEFPDSLTEAQRNSIAAALPAPATDLSGNEVFLHPMRPPSPSAREGGDGVQCVHQ